MADLVKRLRSYKQADETGVMVLVSRQAVDEAADRIEVLEAEVNNAEANHILLSNLVQEQANQDTPMSMDTIARALWGLLDDCDTADDLAKENDALFRNLVRRAQQQRFRYATSDGYNLKFNIKRERD